MKKIIRLFACLLSAVMFNTVATGQQQPTNGGFENWDNVGSDTEEPTNWSGMMTGNLCILCGFGESQRVFRDGTDKHSGNYSARIESTEAGGVLVNGTITTGRVTAPSIEPSEGYNVTLRSNASFNHPFSDRPDSIVFWAKYNITNTSDSARVSVVLHSDYDVREPQDGPSQTYIVAKTAKNFQTNGNWLRMSFPINYSGPSNDVFYLLATFTSSYEPGSGNSSATLWVDDLEFIYNPNTVTITPATDQYLLVDEAGTALTATELANAASQDATITREWKFSTTSGSGYASFSSPQTGATYTPQFNATGTYYVICESTFGGETVTSDEVAIHVSETIPNIATVTPNATQNLDVNESGTTLTVAETPAAASSREWKYSTTSGSGYMSFLSDEFATSYTPVFASAGTYYVICESNFAGEIVTSNEVQINVTSTSGISEFEESDIVVYQNNEKLYLDLTNSSFKGEKVSIYTVDGRQVKETAVTTNAVTAINIDFPNGIYLVVVQSANASSQQKIFIR